MQNESVRLPMPFSISSPAVVSAAAVVSSADSSVTAVSAARFEDQAEGGVMKAGEGSKTGEQSDVSTPECAAVSAEEGQQEGPADVEDKNSEGQMEEEEHGEAAKAAKVAEHAAKGYTPEVSTSVAEQNDTEDDGTMRGLTGSLLRRRRSRSESRGSQAWENSADEQAVVEEPRLFQPYVSPSGQQSSQSFLLHACAT